PITSIRLIIAGAEIALGIGDHVLGRASECAVCVDDPLASRRHAAITVSEENVTIRDLGSRNGVLVNGDDIDHDRSLQEGDLITLGSQALTVLAICHAGERASGPPGLGRQAVARITVQKLAVREGSVREEALLASSTTTLNQTSPVGRQASAFR